MMIRYACIIVTLYTGMLFGITDQERFLQANILYKQGDYSGALALYDAIDPKGRSTWYNLGNCYYRTGSYARALVCWDRSRKGASRAELIDSVNNMQRTQVDKYGSVPINTWRAWLDASMSVVPTWCIYVVVLLTIGLLAIVAYFIARKKWAMSTRWLCCLFVYGCMVALAAASSYSLYGRQWAYVIQKASLHVGPGENYQMLACCNEAQKLVIQAKNNGWYKVSCGSLVGWIAQEAVEVV